MDEKSWSATTTARTAGITTTTTTKVTRAQSVSRSTVGKLRLVLGAEIVAQPKVPADPSGMDRATKRRKLAGQIVEDEYARQGLTRERAAERMSMSPSTLDRIREGDTKITGPKLRSVEGALDLTDFLLTYIIDGDWRPSQPLVRARCGPGCAA